jgi:hypothetical protein
VSPQRRRPALPTPAAGSITPHEDHDEASAAQVAAEVEHHRQRYRRAVEREHTLRVELAEVIADRLDAFGELAVLDRSPFVPEGEHRRGVRSVDAEPGPRLRRARRGLAAAIAEACRHHAGAA